VVLVSVAIAHPAKSVTISSRLSLSVTLLVLACARMSWAMATGLFQRMEKGNKGKTIEKYPS
jgi:hypothetical protein